MLRSRYLRLVSRGAGWRLAKAGVASSAAMAAPPTAAPLTRSRRVIPLGLPGDMIPSRPPCVGGDHSTTQASSVVGRRHPLPAAGVSSGGMCGLVPPAPAGDVDGLRLAGGASSVSMVLRGPCIGGADPAGLLRRTRGVTTIVPSHGGAAPGKGGKEVGNALDQGFAGLEHAGRIDRALGRDRRAERIARANDLDPRRLAVVPLCPIVDAIGADDAVLRGNFGPELGFRTAGSPDAVHVHGQAVSMQRIELVAEAADAEGGRPVGREDSSLDRK